MPLHIFSSAGTLGVWHCSALTWEIRLFGTGFLIHSSICTGKALRVSKEVQSLCYLHRDRSHLLVVDDPDVRHLLSPVEEVLQHVARRDRVGHARVVNRKVGWVRVQTERLAVAIVYGAESLDQRVWPSPACERR